MAYNPNIPVITDPILQSAAQMRTNFQVINEAFAENHVGLTQDPAFSGMHNLLTLRPQNTGAPTTAADQIAIYNAIVGSIPELFFRPNSNQTPIQITYPSILTGIMSTNPDVYFPQQYSFVAGPFIVYGGLIKNPTNGQVVTLTPGANLIYVDLIGANTTVSKDFSSTAAPTGITGTSFTVSFGSRNAGATMDVYYFAIGI